MALNNNNNNIDEVFEEEEGSGYESDLTEVGGPPIGHEDFRTFYDGSTQNGRRVTTKPNLLQDDNQVARMVASLRANNWNNIILDFAASGT